VSERGKVPIVPDSFLGASAPRPRYLYLGRIPFSIFGLRKPLLSAADLIHLELQGSNHLRLNFNRLDLDLTDVSLRVHLLLHSFSVQPSRFTFKGVSKYLDVIIARIDAPLLDDLYITFFNLLTFDTPQRRSGPTWVHATGNSANQMQSVILGAFVRVPRLRFFLVSHSLLEIPLHLRECCTLAGFG